MKEVKSADEVIIKHTSVKDEDADENGEVEEEDNRVEDLSETNEDERRKKQLVVSKTLNYQHIYV